MKYKTFKNETSNLKDYIEEQDNLVYLMEELIYLYTGVKGVSYDGVHINATQHANDERLLALSEKLTPYQKRLDDVTKKINEIESNIVKLPEDTQRMVRLLFVEGHTFKYVGKMCGYSDNAVYHKVRREVEKYV